MSEVEKQEKPQKQSFVSVLKSSVIPTIIMALLYFFSNRYIVNIENDINNNAENYTKLEARVQTIENSVTVKLLDAIEDLTDELENVTDDMIGYNVENKELKKAVINIEKAIIKINTTLDIKESN